MRAILSEDFVQGILALIGALGVAAALLRFPFRWWKGRKGALTIGPSIGGNFFSFLRLLDSPPVLGSPWSPYSENEEPTLPLVGTSLHASLTVAYPGENLDRLAIAPAPLVKTEAYMPPPDWSCILWPPPVGGDAGEHRSFVGVALPKAGALSWGIPGVDADADYYELAPGQQEFFLGTIWFGSPGTYRLRLGIRGCVRGKTFTYWNPNVGEVVVPAQWQAWGANHRDVATLVGEGSFPRDGRLEDNVDTSWFFGDFISGQPEGVIPEEGSHGELP